jgi:hypothetical protein
LPFSKTTTQSKQWLNRRKFAQSGHPASNGMLEVQNVKQITFALEGHLLLERKCDQKIWSCKIFTLFKKVILKDKISKTGTKYLHRRLGEFVVIINLLYTKVRSPQGKIWTISGDFFLTISFSHC